MQIIKDCAEEQLTSAGVVPQPERQQESDYI
jgi:hypothetical protein